MESRAAGVFPPSWPLHTAGFYSFNFWEKSLKQISWGSICMGLYQLAQKLKELSVLLTDQHMDLGRDTYKEIALKIWFSFLPYSLKPVQIQEKKSN